MRPDLVAILECPDCRAEVSLVESDGADDVVTGALACDGCSRSFPIVRGIPRMLPTGSVAGDVVQTKAHFTNEFTSIAAGDSDMDPPEVLRYLFATRTGLDAALAQDLRSGAMPTELGEGTPEPDLSALRGALVLDGGCGPGRFTRVAAEVANRVVALDLGEHVERARDRCRDLGNVEGVQGSILAPPFRKDAFDFAFSIGVLHHTPDPSGGARQLARLVGDGGGAAVWVYAPEYWNGRVRGVVARAIHRRVSTLPAERALQVCRRWLMPLGRLQMALALRRWTKLLASPLFVVSVPRHPKADVMLATIYDYYGPAIISTHEPDEVAGWLREGGFDVVTSLPVRSACLGWKRPVS